MAKRVIFTDDQVRGFVKKYDDGSSLKEVANEAGVSIPTISRLLSKHTKIRGKGRKAQKKSAFDFDVSPPRRVVPVDDN